MKTFKKENIFLDLSKCTEEEQIKVIALLPEPTRSNDYNIDDGHIYLMYDENDEDWWVASNFPKWHLEKRAELTYPEFIKLFEGGESDGWIKIKNEKDLPKEDILYWVVKNGEVVDMENWELTLNFHNKRGLTHYQPIQKPEPPKF